MSDDINDRCPYYRRPKVRYADRYAAQCEIESIQRQARNEPWRVPPALRDKLGHLYAIQCQWCSWWHVATHPDYATPVRYGKTSTLPPEIKRRKRQNYKRNKAMRKQQKAEGTR